MQQESVAAASIAIDHAAWRPRHNPWVVAFTVTLATFMEVLDTSIANIALPHIAGSFGASTNESTWVLTSYLVSNAIVLPVSAWLATRYGRKRYYMFCVVLFAASSFLCGLAPTLGLLVFFRVLQGIGGGGLQPSEQSILADTFSPEQRGMAFSIYAMAVVLAPAIGPTIGGWITDNYSWRWIFYINVPISIVSLFLSYRVVEDPPYLAEERIKAKKGGIDYIGLGLVALGIGCLQMVMDKGQELDWFGSRLITTGLVVAVVVLIVCIWWEWRNPHPIVELKLLKRRNFATAMTSMAALGMVLYG
ncbi:MAG: DHA2 family efflux MFS transporter permease subunit, partial [Candidatus Acidiferrales bacterium]